MRNTEEQLREIMRRAETVKEKRSIDHLCNTICSLSSDVIKSITGRRWILNCFVGE